MIQEIFSSFTPFESVVILIEIVLGGGGSAFFILWDVCDYRKKRREQKQEPVNQWHRRPRMVLGLGIIIFIFPVVLNTIAFKLMLRGYLPHSVGIFFTVFGILSMCVSLVLMVYVGMLQMFHKKMEMESKK